MITEQTTTTAPETLLRVLLLRAVLDVRLPPLHVYTPGRGTAQPHPYHVRGSALSPDESAAAVSGMAARAVLEADLSAVLGLLPVGGTP